MKKTLPIIALTAISIINRTNAQDIIKPPKDTTITRGGFISANFNQVQLSDWAQGGESSLSGTFLANGFYNYKKDKTTWDNSLDIAYGLLKSTSETGQGKARKNEDKIDFTSKYGRLAVHKVYYTALLNFKSQFAKGYNYPNDSTVASRFFAPAYLTLAIGLDYKPNEYFSVFASPAAGKATFVTDKALSAIGAYGVEPGKMFRLEFGASLVAKFQKDVFTNVNLLSKLTLFNNYTDKNAAKRANFDVNFETMVSMKVNKYLSASVFLNMIYDDDILVPIDKANPDIKGKRLQIKEVLGIALSYKF